MSPKIPHIDVTRAKFGKHKGRLWSEIVEDPEGYSYIGWVIDTVEISNAEYEHLMNLLEENAP